MLMRVALYLLGVSLCLDVTLSYATGWCAARHKVSQRRLDIVMPSLCRGVLIYHSIELFSWAFAH